MKIDSHLIARMSGVSQSTVSRTFSNPDKVSQRTREKVLQAAESLGYKPDKNASALRRKGTGTILLLHINRGSELYWTNIKRNYWIFTEALLSLTRFFEDKPFIFEVKSIQSVHAIKDSEITDMCDGLLVFDFVTDEEARIIESWNHPYVLCHRSLHLKGCNLSATDNREGGRIQGRYLKEKGCRKPVYIMNSEDPFSHELRKQGFLDIFPGAVVVNRAVNDAVRADVSELIDSGSVDGMAFVNDMLLVQISLLLHTVSLDIQALFPLIGYDDSTELLVLGSKPATVEIGIGNIYRDAARALLGLIQGDDTPVFLAHSPRLVREKNQ